MNKAMAVFLRVTFVVAFCMVANTANAATLRLSPDTGVYTVGSAFSVSVMVNTDGKSVNAADGQLSFNTNELRVVGVSRGGSVFNLWTEEPTFSNTAGTVSFGGGSPSGYKGNGGNIITITFSPLGAGTPKVTFKSGSVLAADGLGTNVLTAMSGGTYTIAAKTEAPAPEYIPPPNTPRAPVVSSDTHPDSAAWYRERTAHLMWQLPSDIIAVRMLLDDAAGTVPTIVYDTPPREKTLTDLPEGVSYFHIQFKNSDGWGRIAHYRLAIDTKPPATFSVTDVPSEEAGNPNRALTFTLEDVSPIREFRVQIDGAEPLTVPNDAGTNRYQLGPLTPGYHSFIIEAVDSAGNSSIASHSFTILAFEKPIFTEYPTRLDTDVIPAIRGTTRPGATVIIEVRRASDGVLITAVDAGTTDGSYSVKSDDTGNFTFIPDEPFDVGVYTIRAVAHDEFGQMSEPSDEVRIIVEKPGYIVIGSLVVSVLSILVPLVALLVFLVFGTWYLWHRLVRWRRRVRKEKHEAEDQLTPEFDAIVKNLNKKVGLLKTSRKGKLTKSEAELIEQIESDIRAARGRIAKEIEDIEDVVK